MKDKPAYAGVPPGRMGNTAEGGRGGRPIRAPLQNAGRVRRWRWRLLPLGLVTSWAALAGLVVTTGPEAPKARVIFFGVFFLAVMLTSTLLWYLLSWLLSRGKARPGRLGHALLQGLAVGLIATAAAWFQSVQALTPASGLMLAGILVALEVILAPRAKY